MRLKIDIIDAFTNEKFKGNQAGVVILDYWLDEKLMQNIANENNISETAFIVKDKNDTFHIRWFSPIKEIAFCGHGSLASAFVLFNKNKNIFSLKFYAKAVGFFNIIKKKNGFIQMGFPNKKPKKLHEIPVELIGKLSIKPKEVYVNEQAYFFIYDKEEDILNIKYQKNFEKKTLSRNIVVTAPCINKKYDFISRYFSVLGNGGLEDAVTGSIHTGLAPFWEERLNKNELVAFQASKRSGFLLCKVTKDKVFICGNAVQYLQGYINV